MRRLDPDMAVDIDKINEASWAQLISAFRDACIYQTWAFDAVGRSEKGTSHITLRRGRQTVAAAQVRLYRIPYARTGIAYVYWGPLWQNRELEFDLGYFRQTIRALRNEYVSRRGFVLRIKPCLFREGTLPYHSVLREEGYSFVSSESEKRTLLMDLTPSLEVLRKGFDPKWRNHLNRADKNRLEILEGKDDDLFGIFLDIYKDLVNRKGFPLPNDIHRYREIQKGLPDDQKMMIILCYANGRPGAGAICHSIGDTGITLFRATNETGMESGGSYLVQWRILEWAKGRHCVHYDLNGINPASNPGTYRFKSGVSGKNGRDLYYLGVYEAYPTRVHELGAKSLGLVREVRRKISGWRSQTHLARRSSTD